MIKVGVNDVYVSNLRELESYLDRELERYVFKNNFIDNHIKNQKEDIIFDSLESLSTPDLPKVEPVRTLPDINYKSTEIMDLLVNESTYFTRYRIAVKYMDIAKGTHINYNRKHFNKNIFRVYLNLFKLRRSYIDPWDLIKYFDSTHIDVGIILKENISDLPLFYRLIYYKHNGIKPTPDFIRECESSMESDFIYSILFKTKPRLSPLNETLVLSSGNEEMRKIYIDALKDGESGLFYYIVNSDYFIKKSNITALYTAYKTYRKINKK